MANLQKVWIVMKGSDPRGVYSSEQGARDAARDIVPNLYATHEPVTTTQVVHLRVLFVDDAVTTDDDLMARHG